MGKEINEQVSGWILGGSWDQEIEECSCYLISQIDLFYPELGYLEEFEWWSL